MNNYQKQIADLALVIRSLRDEISKLRSGQSKFDNLTCYGCDVVDKENRALISCGTSENGQANMIFSDKDDNSRIILVTRSEHDYESGLYLLDEAGNYRVAATTNLSGHVGIHLMDSDEMDRVRLGISSDNEAYINISDDAGDIRIEASTSDDGTFNLPIRDEKFA